MLDAWSARFRIYGDANVPVGTTYQSCTDFSGTVQGEVCTGTACDETTIVEPLGDVLTGGKTILDLNGDPLNIFQPGDQYIVKLNFASDVTTGSDVIGAVLVDLLPLGMSYVPDSWEYTFNDILGLLSIQPDMQTGFDSSGRQWVRFTYDDSLGNGIVIPADGTWSGFGIQFAVNIDTDIPDGYYLNNYYYSSTDSNHDCASFGLTGPPSFFGGYTFDDDYCQGSGDLHVISTPGSAGNGSYKEVKGTLDNTFHRFPDTGPVSYTHLTLPTTPYV